MKKIKNLEIMKKIAAITIIVLLPFSIFGQANDFYYAFDQTVQLNEQAGKFVVEFPDGITETSFIQNNIVYTKINDNVYLVPDTASIQNIATNYYITPEYAATDGLEMYVTREIVLKFKDNTSLSAKNNLINTYNLQEIKITSIYNLYQVNNALQVSQSIYETNLVKFCYPNFISKVERLYTPNDTYFNKQFYLHNTGQVINDGNSGTADADIDAPEAWDITKGNSSITVAIVDEGVTDAHPDLPSSRQVRLTGSNFAAPYDGTNADDPAPVGDGNHGNACAGIVAAEQDNNEGVSGIAPLCKIMPVRIPFGAYPATVYADAITFAYNGGANVISNSWGYGSSNPVLYPVIITAIENAINGGSSVLFAAGNTADHNSSNAGYVTFPGNADITGLITVGASDRNDIQANYSPTSELIELTAPSHLAYPSQISGESLEIWTIDIPGNDGYNTWKASGWNPPAVGEVLPNSGTNNLSYTGRMGGTSAATPEVAAVAALMLSVNPCLTPLQIKDILERTADKVGGYDYSWEPTKPGHSQELGYGRVNAYEAVNTASLMYNAGIDLYMRDQPNDYGIEPNPIVANWPPRYWTSKDMWIRYYDDDGTVHQNPEHTTSLPIWVYVRVRNKGCQASLGTDTLKTYWTTGNIALSDWDNSWINYYYDFGSGSVLTGDAIGKVIIPVLNPGESTIIKFPWFAPNPIDFPHGGADVHVCLLARIETSPTPPYGMTFTETQNIWPNTQNNNNIIWKNVTVVNDISWDKMGLVVGNSTGFLRNYNLLFKVPDEELNNPFTADGKVTIDLGEEIYDKWVRGGKKGSGFVEEGQFNHMSISGIKHHHSPKQFPNAPSPYNIVITGTDAVLENIEFEPEELINISIRFNFNKQPDGVTQKKFNFDIMQANTDDGTVIAGVLFDINRPECQLPDAGSNVTILNKGNTTLSAAPVIQGAVYTWRDDKTGFIAGIGSTLNVSPDVTTTYELELQNTNGCIDYDVVTVTVQKKPPKERIHINPNPAKEHITAKCDLKNAQTARIEIRDVITGLLKKQIQLDVTKENFPIWVGDLQLGAYSCFLHCDNVMVGNEQLIIIQ